MAVPEEIRKVPRPRNTIVEDSGTDGTYRYAVRERSRVIYEPGMNPRPVNGKVIGHIIDLAFHPLTVKSKTGADGPADLSYGGSAFVHSVSADLLTDLEGSFNTADAMLIMTIASLRAIKPDIASNRYGSEYKRTFLSVFYPGMSLSKNSICTFLQNLGMDRAKRQAFIKKRIDAVCEQDHIAIDGTLKQDTSSVNGFSAFSYKGRVRGVKDISILYAYSIETQEPICAEVFPGNCIDAAAFKEFIQHNNLTKGLILADKGFPLRAIEDELKNRPMLHYLLPLKRNDSRIKKYGMLKFNKAIIYGGRTKILCRKVKMEHGSFLYSYQDLTRESLEKNSYVERAALSANQDIDVKKYERKREVFGVIVFESDQDLDLLTIYKCFAERWGIECLFDMYKHDEDLTKTEVQNEFYVRGSEFIDLIATTITARCVKKADQAGLLRNITYRSLLSDLDQLYRAVDAPREVKMDDGGWTHHFKEGLEELVELGLCAGKAELKVPGKRGRPRKNPQPADAAPKRKRGRPRKNPEPTADAAPKRHRGRSSKKEKEAEAAAQTFSGSAV